MRARGAEQTRSLAARGRVSPRRRPARPASGGLHDRRGARRAAGGQPATAIRVDGLQIMNRRTYQHPAHVSTPGTCAGA